VMFILLIPRSTQRGRAATKMTESVSWCKG
jgi:hypothetical protein